MALLDELFSFKEKLFELLCGDEKIVQLLLDEKDVKIPNRELLFTTVFPYLYAPETVAQTQTYLCFDIEAEEVPDNTYLDFDVFVWMFCHESKIEVKDGGGTRPDQLAMQTQRVLSLSDDFGATQLRLESVTSVFPIKEHWGKMLQYKTIAFNTPNSARNQLRGSTRRRIP